MLKIKKLYDDLPWLEPHQERLGSSLAGGTCPHSLIIQGAVGMGRRQLAVWLAREVLGGEVLQPEADGSGYARANPDFMVLEAPYIDRKSGKERKSLGVDVIRDDLIPFISLTSHGQRGRVAVIYPADSMTANAANSLLKTLEEPPPGALIILICERLAQLPATVISRCQQLRLAAPAAEVASGWLATQVPDHDFRRLLDFAGGAPLAALQLHEQGFAEFANGFLAAVDKLEQSAISPTAVAAQCRKQEDLALRLLEWRLAARLRDLVEAARGLEPAAEAGFQQLSQIRELRRVLNGGINAELSLAGLLFDWYGGLGHSRE